MSAAVTTPDAVDQTDLPHVLRAIIRLGIFESLAVLVIGLVARFVSGAAAQLLLLLLVSVAVLAVSFLPGLWTRARTIEGIAGAAGIGLGATVVFLIVDVALFQPFGLYTHRWRDIGGGSNWWYHPVWWMVGTFLPWFGAWILANQADRHGRPNPATAVGSVLVGAAVATIVGVLIHVPGAGWNVGTYGVAFLPGLVLATIASGLGAHRK
ncbi:MAG TPA: hypothetical protein VMG41_16785 [Gemmatimonadales bacterium]|nr:hypothetical protein [Gemmatimonadales bacterium]